jgi:hypothetical protein
MDYKWATRLDALSQHYIELVMDWWTFKTIVSPNREDIVKLKVSTKQFKVHSMHYLQVSQVHFNNPMHVQCFTITYGFNELCLDTFCIVKKCSKVD